MIKKEQREKEYEKFINNESKKRKNDKFKRKITEVVGIVLLVTFISVSLITNLNESDFRTLAIVFLLVYCAVWSEQYEFFFVLIVIFLFGSILLFLVLPTIMSVRF